MAQPQDGSHVPGGYTGAQLADLERVLAFNRRLATAVAESKDVSQVVRSLDPDPLRYMAVDEGGGRISEYLTHADALLAETPPLEGQHREESHAVWDSGFAVRPSVAASPDGHHLLYAWVEWEKDAGERILAGFAADGGRVRGAQRLVDHPVDCFRPVALYDTSGRAWVFYARSGDDGVAIRARRHEHGRWLDEDLVSTTEHPSFNLEAAAHSDGTVEVCWQGRRGRRFAIFSRHWSGGRWGEPRRVSTGSADNVWDPVVAALPGGGSCYAWTEYHDGAYRVVSRIDTGTGFSEPRPLHSGTDYALHPSLAVTPDGGVWCAFDVLTVQGHGGSGPTRLRHTDQLGGESHVDGTRESGDYVPAELLPEIAASLRVARVDGDGVAEPPGALAPGLEVVPGGLPKIAVDGSGTLHLAYRVLRRLPLMSYYWEVATQSLGPDGWRAPVTYDASDGPVEEVTLAGLPYGAVVGWQTDERLERALNWKEGFGGWTAPDTAAHLGHIVWNSIHGTGSLRSAAVRGSSGETTTEPSLTHRPVLESSARTEARAWIRESRERYTTTVGDQKLSLYWGDLHRHSIVSRCTGADEPSLEDFYRYAWDVSEYDFWAVTDHAENSSDYQWWCIQKTADLFRVDGGFVPLYGFEWTSMTGHQNVIYSSVERGAPIYSAFAEGSQTPAELWNELSKHPDFPAITIPHHPGAAMVPFDWSYYDPRYLRIAEVFQSCRGNYEDDGCFRQYSDATLPGTFVLDGLRHGHRFGLIASSDHGNGTAYVGAYAADLDRGSVFDALWSRRTFGATTRNLVLDVRVNDAFMGAETRRSGRVPVEVYARGSRELARVDILRNGELAHSRVPDLDLPDGWISVPLRVEWGLGHATTDWSGRLSVARSSAEILQTPYWSPEIVEAGSSEVQWSAVTKTFGEPYGAQRGGIEITVLGPEDGMVDVQTAHGSASVALERLRRQAVDVPVTAQGRLRLQPGTGGLRGLGAQEQRVRWTDGAPGSAWYYARVFQIDGEMAWSSPVWVDDVSV